MEELVKQAWEDDNSYGRPGFQFLRKLSNIKRKVKSWAKEMKGEMENEKRRIRNRIEELDRWESTSRWRPEYQRERGILRNKWEFILLREDRAARLKSKFKWAKEGDANTKLFHGLMRARRMINTMTKLELPNGEILTEWGGIRSYIIQFFTNLYVSENLQVVDTEGVDWKPITEDTVTELEKPFTEEEVVDAIKQCDGDKAPGPDGFSMDFYKKYWKVLRTGVMKVFEDFHSNGVVNRAVNETYIVLIPKKSGSMKLEDFRPISLVTSLYKIIAKVLARRLKEAISSTISENQSAFVKDRQILDAILIANESVEDTRVHKKEGVVIKIDFFKAYDHVDWGFLGLVLEKKGFGARWRSWMRGCISSTNFSIFINGRPQGKFSASRGIRQGDPLSPLLFILVVDPLSRMINKAVEEGSIRCMQVGKKLVSVSHLQFADDTLFMIKKDRESIQNLKGILQAFCGISGLKINPAKSVVLGINVEAEEVEEIAQEFGYEVGQWPLKYLGLPLGDNPIKKSFWEPMMAKINRRLESWKQAFLSKGGRYTLIKSVLSSMPIYYLSLFKVPASTEVAIERRFREFLWGNIGERGCHLVNWKIVQKLRSEGGLEIGNIRKKNKALMGKWIWRFANEKEAFWRRVIESRYGEVAGGWMSGKGSKITARSPWKGICAARSEFLRYTSLKLGNGERIRFWKDVFMDNMCMQQSFPRIFGLSTNPNGFVKEFFENTLIGNYSWRVHLRRGLLDEECNEMEGFIAALERIKPCTSVEDKWIWDLDESKSFTCKSFFRELIKQGNGTGFDFEKKIWKLEIPEKIKFMVWTLILKKLSTQDNLQKRKPNTCLLPSICGL